MTDQDSAAVVCLAVAAVIGSIGVVLLWITF